MMHRTNIIVLLIVCFSSALLNKGMLNSAYAERRPVEEAQQTGPNKIYGKVTEVLEASIYTYAEVDTGKRKVWAAGPITPLAIGDMIGFSTDMPMENFHSESMGRDFPIIYFVVGFITDKETRGGEAAAPVSPHSQMKQEQVAEPVTGINKVEGGNTIAEIYAQKHELNGKTIRVRGKVTKFTAAVMGKNWIHVRDSSTLDDLAVTTDSTVALGDVIIITGKLSLDKDYNYGYFYKVLLEDAGITKE